MLSYYYYYDEALWLRPVSIQGMWAVVLSESVHVKSVVSSRVQICMGPRTSGSDQQNCSEL